MLKTVSPSLTRMLPWSLGVLLATVLAACVADLASTVWFEQPATKFHQSLVLGNGRIGPMVCSGMDEERIVLNGSSVWSGSRVQNNIPGAICRAAGIHG